MVEITPKLEIPAEEGDECFHDTAMRRKRLCFTFPGEEWATKCKAGDIVNIRCNDGHLHPALVTATGMMNEARVFSPAHAMHDYRCLAAARKFTKEEQRIAPDLAAKKLRQRFKDEITRDGPMCSFIDVMLIEV